MNEKLDLLKSKVTEASANPDFVHHKWFVKYHLEIVERIALELLEFYPGADRDVVVAMAWMHDYGKILDFDNQYDVTLTAGPQLMQQLGFDDEFTKRVIGGIEILDQNMEIDINQASLEVKIVSSADGCSHLVGPFMSLWLYENPQKSVEELLAGNIRKADKDWSRKIVLPEARAAFQARHDVVVEQSGVFPDTFLNPGN